MVGEARDSLDPQPDPHGGKRGRAGGDGTCRAVAAIAGEGRGDVICGAATETKEGRNGAGRGREAASGAARGARRVGRG